MTPPGAESSALADGEIVARVRAGDSDAFSELYRRHYAKVFRIAYRMTGSVAAAEDLAQDIFMKAFRKCDQFRGEASFATWLHRIAVSVCLNARAATKPAEPLAETIPSRERVEQDVLQRQVREEVHRALLALKPKLRIAVILRDLEGLSYDEIAERLDVAAGTVASRLNEARRLLARRLAHLKGVV